MAELCTDIMTVEITFRRISLEIVLQSIVDDCSLEISNTSRAVNLHIII